VREKIPLPFQLHSLHRYTFFFIIFLFFCYHEQRDNLISNILSLMASSNHVTNSDNLLVSHISHSHIFGHDMDTTSFLHNPIPTIFVGACYDGQSCSTTSTYASYYESNSVAWTTGYSQVNVDCYPPGYQNVPHFSSSPARGCPSGCTTA